MKPTRRDALALGAALPVVGLLGRLVCPCPPRVVPGPRVLEAVDWEPVELPLRPIPVDPVAFILTPTRKAATELRRLGITPPGPAPASYR